MINLATIITATTIAMMVILPITKRGSASIPREIKNMATKVSRNGTTLASACRAKVDWLISNPATKAPNAADKPKKKVPKAAARHRVTTVSRNSSPERSPATLPNSQGNTHIPRASITPIKITAFRMDNPRVSHNASSPPPTVGRIIISGTTLKSCTRRIPIMMRPCPVSSSPRSIRVFSTTIVLLRAMRKPKKTASKIAHPNSLPRANPTAAVSSIWTIPPRMAILPIRISSLKENSRPRVNRSRITPILAKTRTVSRSLTKPKP